MNPLWLLLIVPVAASIGFLFAALLISGNRADERMTMLSAFEYGYDFGKRNILYSLAVRKFYERFKV
jgi:hypothetical protein